MKTYLIIIFLAFATISFAQENQTNWKSELNFGNGFSITTFLKVNKTRDNSLTIVSPKNADVRLFGRFKSKLGRFFGKLPKKGILMTIRGTQKGDSIIGDTKIPMLGKLKFRGIIKEHFLSGDFIKDDTINIGKLEGEKSMENHINYAYLYPKILKITQNNIYSKSILQTKKWDKNKKKIKKLLNRVQEDIELFIGFNMLGNKAPFSHYGIFIQQDKTDTVENNKTEIDEQDETTVIFKELENNTAYLKIKNFSSSQKELSNTLPKIIEKKYKNLIIDLRDNGGGGLEAAFELAKYIEDKEIVVGYFVTNKLKYSGFQLELFNKLPVVKMQSTEEFISNLKKGKGSKLVFSKSNNPVFLGNLYVLTNKNTASTCEPIVYQLKNSNRATIIGENTMGAMLSAAYFKVQDKYKLYLPIADFYTYDGVRLEGVGVKPNVKTKSENALNKALSIINE